MNTHGVFIPGTHDAPFVPTYDSQPYVSLPALAGMLPMEDSNLTTGNASAQEPQPTWNYDPGLIDPPAHPMVSPMALSTTELQPTLPTSASPIPAPINATTALSSTPNAPQGRRKKRAAHPTPGNTREHLCSYEGCSRSQVGNGFIGRPDNLRMHKRLVHGEVIEKGKPGRKAAGRA